MPGSGAAMRGNLPNILTFTRILILPFFAASLIYREYHFALFLFVAAAVTDLMDGFIARVTKQITYFGTILDPVADKFFLITSYVLMSMYELIPTWLTIVVLSKDLIVITGVIILYFATDSLKVDPTFLGKLSSACQFILIGIVLLVINIGGQLPMQQVLYFLVAGLTALSGVHYVYEGLKIANPENTE